jgi:hypothetical protein
VVAGCLLSLPAAAGERFQSVSRKTIEPVGFNAIALAKLQLCAKIRSCMKQYAKILFSIFTATICAMAFAADQPACQKTGKNCPMNNGGACNCGKSCDC